MAIVMELVDGIPYRKLFKRGPILEHEFLRYFRQLVGALEAVHSASIIHRDVNPRNVLLLPDETVKLGDFGLSCVAGEESRPGGTIGYMAPEALRKDQRTDYGVDVDGLGFLAYQSLLGGPMFLRLYGTIKAIEWARWVLSREKFRTLIALGAPRHAGTVRDRREDGREGPPRAIRKMSDVRKDLEKAPRPPDRRVSYRFGGSATTRRATAWPTKATTIPAGRSRKRCWSVVSVLTAIARVQRRNQGPSRLPERDDDQAAIRHVERGEARVGLVDFPYPLHGPEEDAVVLRERRAVDARREQGEEDVVDGVRDHGRHEVALYGARMGKQPDPQRTEDEHGVVDEDRPGDQGKVVDDRDRGDVVVSRTGSGSGWSTPAP